MESSTDAKIKQFNEELDTLKATEAGLYDQLTKLDTERRVLQDMANPPRQVFNESTGHESGPAPAQPDPVNAAMARERLDKLQNEFDGTKTAYGQAQAAITDTNVKREKAEADKKTEITVENYGKEVTDLGSRVENTSNVIEGANQLDAVTQGAAFGDAFQHLDVGIPGSQLREVVEYGKVFHDYQSTKDSMKIIGDDLFHQQQIAEIDALRGQIDVRIANAEKVMESTMGTKIDEMAVNAQREFYSNEYSMAFQQVEQLRSGQEQQREAFFASNNALLPEKIVEQQQHRVGLNQELQAHQYGLSRELASEQATINVDLSNQQMLNDNQARLKRQKTSPEEIDKQQEKLTGVQQKEYHNDLHMETNKIQSQNSPELYQNPPTIQAPGVTAPAPPAPQQQGPAGPAM